ncbi:hypothetical protein BU26DRAFT_535063 [Trematosphaeria pertusa]|uniref:Uncharacterized protein n=1 Tax=Trematosphaeria pertusa TaxID=390896 RepID=A0A6A6HVQ6_9PLEO|nr:uncharacterized protein BU26DRAFT_535063 [Trematosphaeria pertusa]KAF2242111.1 hypothetical protein BU26DRAFT_535063 [Trematosphaeria pertusa]
MRDRERELADSVERRRRSEAEPLAGLFNLTREMEGPEEEQFDVDLTIMDFLAYKAIDLVFEWRSSSNPYESDLPGALVTMTAEWRTFLKHRHGGRRLNTQAAFRSRLLQFVLLFSHRLNHDKTWTTEESLNEIRALNKKRGSYWQQYTAHAPALRQPFDTLSEFPLSDGALAENRHELACALGMPQDKRRWVTDVEGTPSLHCLLPLFVELTAARVDLGDWVPTEGWLDLVGQFMLQAVLEEYLRNGAYGEEYFNTIFAFGCPGTDRRPDDGADIQSMRTLFCVEGSPREQIHGWSRTKRRYIDELLPHEGSPTSFLQAMERAQRRFSYTDFEDSMLSFLKYLHDGLVKPDLVQVEEGRITIHGNELPEADSREMIRRMGLQ